MLKNQTDVVNSSKITEPWVENTQAGLSHHIVARQLCFQIRYNEKVQVNSHVKCYNSIKILKVRKIIMQVQSQKQSWKLECLAQWDRQCLQINEAITNKKLSLDSVETFDSQSQRCKEIKHFVSPGDTLEGLSLLYDVLIDSIKQRNSLHSNEIYFVRQLIIPNANMASRFHEQPSEQSKISELLKQLHVGKEQKQLGRRILSESGWNVERAVKKYHRDMKWEKENSNILRIFSKKKL